MRYAVNKRVLLEVALIKLCRPQMERDELSMGERVRRLEKMLEEGTVAVASGSPALSGGQPDRKPDAGGGRELPSGEEESGPRYAKAAPEDLQQIKTMWSSIIAGTSQRFRIVLSSAQLKFNTAPGAENQLYVVFSDFLGETYLNNPQYKEQLEELIAEKTGRQADVRFVLAADEHVQNARLSAIEIEKAVKDFVHMDIEIEE